MGLSSFLHREGMRTFCCLSFNPITNKDYPFPSTPAPPPPRPTWWKAFLLYKENLSFLGEQEGRVQILEDFEYQIKVFELGYFGNKK